MARRTHANILRRDGTVVFVEFIAIPMSVGADEGFRMLSDVASEVLADLRRRSEKRAARDRRERIALAQDLANSKTASVGSCGHSRTTGA